MIPYRLINIREDHLRLSSINAEQERAASGHRSTEREFPLFPTRQRSCSHLSEAQGVFVSLF